MNPHANRRSDRQTSFLNPFERPQVYHLWDIVGTPIEFFNSLIFLVMYRVPTVEDRFWERLVERSSHTYPWKIHEDWLSHHLRIFPRTGRTRLNNPSLLEVEAGLVYPSDSHSTPLFSTLLTQCGGLSPRPKYKTEKVQPSVAGQSYHITGDLRNSTKVGTP